MVSVTTKDNPLRFLREIELIDPKLPFPDIEANSHVHLPPNFSSLAGVDAAVRRARDENVRVLGINNYYGITNYTALAEACFRNGIYPLLGLETIIRDDRMAEAGIRANDPKNPGKIYLCGKGLSVFPVSDTARMIYGGIAQRDCERGRAMIDKINALDATGRLGIELNYDGIRAGIAERFGVDIESVVLQERHIAGALAEALNGEDRHAAPDRWRAYFAGLDDAPDPVAVAASGTDAVQQNFIRTHIMKIGRPAFVEENFIDRNTAESLIHELGGVVVYPVLADGVTPICEFESTPETLIGNLKNWNIRIVEFIPTRNDAALLEKYTDALEDEGFFMTAGTEHNAPGDAPMAPACKGGAPIPPRVRERFLHGAYILAAHQYLRAAGEPGLESVCYHGCQHHNEFSILGKHIVASVVMQAN